MKISDENVKSRQYESTKACILQYNNNIIMYSSIQYFRSKCSHVHDRESVTSESSTLHIKFNIYLGGFFKVSFNQHLCAFRLV